jgi:hypothetical protein
MDIKLLEEELARTTHKAREAFKTNSPNAERIKNTLLDAKAEQQQLFDIETKAVTKYFVDTVHAVRAAFNSGGRDAENLLKFAESAKYDLIIAKNNRVQRMVDMAEKYAHQGEDAKSKDLLDRASKDIKYIKRLEED